MNSAIFDEANKLRILFAFKFEIVQLRRFSKVQEIIFKRNSRGKKNHISAMNNQFLSLDLICHKEN